MELVDFLLREIAADEEVARGAADRNGPRWATHDVQDGATVTGDLRREANPRSYGEDDSLWDDEGALGMWEETAAHIARWDPARVLAECAAKRRIVEEFTDAWSQVETGDRDYVPRRNVLRDAVLLLAQPYADRPGWESEWAL